MASVRRRVSRVCFLEGTGHHPSLVVSSGPAGGSDQSVTHPVPADLSDGLWGQVDTVYARQVSSKIRTPQGCRREGGPPGRVCNEMPPATPLGAITSTWIAAESAHSPLRAT